MDIGGCRVAFATENHQLIDATVSRLDLNEVTAASIVCECKQNASTTLVLFQLPQTCFII